MAMFKNTPTLNITVVRGNSENAALRARSFGPHVVLVDADLPREISLHIIVSFKKSFSNTRIVVMNLHAVQEVVLEFVKLGVAGFLVKDSKREDILSTINFVVKGMKVLSPTLTASLFSQIERHAVFDGSIGQSNSSGLTKREQEIATLIQEGLSNKDIAHRLSIATHTVKSHVHNILEKLGAHTRLQVGCRLQPSPLSNNSLNNQVSIKGDTSPDQKD